MGIGFWLSLTLLCIAVQSFFSMVEMALVSFNKVRLQFYASQGKKRARWIHQLLSKPSHLFGTTLLGVNIALQVGSECSRNLYTSLNLDPDIAPLTQVFLVMIFAELAPMFAARRFAEHVAMLGIPIIYATSKVMTPFIWLIGGISHLIYRIFGGPKGPIYSALSREELQHVVEQHRGGEPTEGEHFNALVQNIFSFRQLTARDAMTPLDLIRMLSAKATVEDLRQMLSRYDVPCLPIYFRTRENIVAITFPRDLVTIDDKELVRNHSHTPWFITHSTPLIQILKQFRHNNQDVAVVLDSAEKALGLLTLEDILNELFGQQAPTSHRKLLRKPKRKQLVERTLPGDTSLRNFNRDYESNLPEEEAQTLSELITHRLGHPPEVGEKITVGSFELIAQETSLLGVKSVQIRTTR